MKKITYNIKKELKENMEETFIVLMLRNEKTGFLEKELNSYKIDEEENTIVNMYAKEENNAYVVHLKLSTPREVEDWEFDAIYDYYDGSLFDKLISDFFEVEDCYNPTWELVFEYIEDDNHMLEKINDILQIHKSEILDVLEEIKLHREEYI